jgi:hypothetical protein
MEDIYEAPFTAADHTKLVRAVLERPLHVIKYLNVPDGQSPTTLQVIDAALKVKSFDASTKARLQDARAGYIRFEAERANDSASFTQHLQRVHAALDGKSIADMIAALDVLMAQDLLDDGSKAGLELAKAILVDGADSIYSPDFSAYELFETTTSTGGTEAVAPAAAAAAAAGHTTGAQQVAQVDADFAAAGGPSSSAGAAAGAASVGAAISVIYDAFFS